MAALNYPNGGPTPGSAGNGWTIEEEYHSLHVTRRGWTRGAGTFKTLIGALETAKLILAEDTTRSVEAINLTKFTQEHIVLHRREPDPDAM